MTRFRNLGSSIASKFTTSEWVEKHLSWHCQNNYIPAPICAHYVFKVSNGRIAGMHLIACGLAMHLLYSIQCFRGLEEVGVTLGIPAMLPFQFRPMNQRIPCAYVKHLRCVKLNRHQLGSWVEHQVRCLYMCVFNNIRVWCYPNMQSISCNK